MFNVCIVAASFGGILELSEKVEVILTGMKSVKAYGTCRVL